MRKWPDVWPYVVNLTRPLRWHWRRPRLQLIMYMGNDLMRIGGTEGPASSFGKDDEQMGKRLLVALPVLCALLLFPHLTVVADPSVDLATEVRAVATRVADLENKGGTK